MSEIKEHKTKFQLERMILFSDAVFSIAITLLVIELKLPEFEHATNQQLGQSLIHNIPHFFSFIMSFMIIGLYWIAHHRMFYYVINYDQKLIWLNLLLLFFIVLMPYSSSVYGVYSYLNLAFYMYVINITMIALFIYFLYSHISNPKKNLSHGLENPKLVRYHKYRAWIVPLCFGVGVVISLCFNTWWSISLSRMSPILIFPAMMIAKKKHADVIKK